MMKDARKALGTFWSTQFLQGVIFEDFHQKHPPGDNFWAVYRAAAQKQRRKKWCEAFSPRENFINSEKVENQSKFEFQTISR